MNENIGRPYAGQPHVRSLAYPSVAPGPPPSNGHTRRCLLPAGLDVGGVILTFRPHARCPCRDCVWAWLWYQAGLLDDQIETLEQPDAETLPWE